MSFYYQLCYLFLIQFNLLVLKETKHCISFKRGSRKSPLLILLGLFNCFGTFLLHSQRHLKFFATIKVQFLWHSINPVTRPQSKHIAMNYHLFVNLLLMALWKLILFLHICSLLLRWQKTSPNLSFFYFKASSMLSLLPCSPCRGW
jgi:hypothetical protein